MKVIEVGANPGSWSQVIAHAIASPAVKPTLFAIDITQMHSKVAYT